MATFKIKSVFSGIDRISPALDTINRNVKSFSSNFKSSLKVAETQQKRLNSAIKIGAGLFVARAAFTKVKSGIQSVLVEGTKLDATLRSAAVRFPEGIRPNTIAFNRLKSVVKGLGETTEFTANQAASALNFLALAGFNAAQAVAALPSILDLATANQLDLAIASDIVTDSLSAFGLATKDPIALMKNLNRVTDVFTKTSSSANATVEQLFETFKEAAPIATGLKISLESVAAITGKLADGGKKASDAGTTLKNTFLALTDPKNARFFEELGVKIATPEGGLRDILDILEDFQGAISKVGTVQQQAAINTIFGKRAIAGLNILFEEGIGSVREYRDKLEKAANTTKTFAEVMRAGPSVQLALLNSGFSALKLEVFEAMEPIILRVARALRGTLKVITKWVELNRNQLVVTFNRIINVVSFFISGIKLLSKTVLFLVNNPIVRIIAVLVVLKNAMVITRFAMLLLNTAFLANPIGIFIVSAIVLFSVLASFPKVFNKIKEVGLAVFKFLTGSVKRLIESVKKVFGFFRKSKENELGGRLDIKREDVLVTPSQLLTESEKEERKQNSTIDVNFKGVPDNVEIKPKELAPSLKLNVGVSF